MTVLVDDGSLRVEKHLTTWDGDGLGAFLAARAEEFRGWDGPRAWRSLEGDLRLSAVHTGRSVRLAWELWGDLLGDTWQLTYVTEHAPGEDMRGLAADVDAFLRSC
ncbi:hypothetical protein G3I42_16075 [Streptomyces sp. SID11385]|nr:hypothetical protein [Streptomyces sp. SID11385]